MASPAFGGAQLIRSKDLIMKKPRRQGDKPHPHATHLLHCVSLASSECIKSRHSDLLLLKDTHERHNIVNPSDSLSGIWESLKAAAGRRLCYA